MSEREFELYLSLLSRFLRLNPAQREEIADELRDHLAERLDELTSAGGMSRGDAIHRALSEFGDAADLAAHFTQLSRRRKRRLIMRCTLGTVTATAIVILLATAFWPQNAAVNLPPRVVAQDERKVGGGAVEKQMTKPSPPSTREEREAKLEALLETPVQGTVVDEPLNNALTLLLGPYDAPIRLDVRFIEDAGIDMKQPVNFDSAGNPVTMRTALEMILEQHSDTQELGITVRDGFIYLTEKGRGLKIEIYNVRDLLEGVEGKLVLRGHGAVVPAGFAGGFGGGGGGFGGGGGGFFQVEDSPGGDNEGMGLAGGQPKVVPSGTTMVYRQTAGEALISVITATVQPETWVEMGGDGSIEEFNGLLVVRAGQEVHREIKQLLEMMRSAAQEQPDASPRGRGRKGRATTGPGSGFGSNPPGGGFGSTPPGGGFGSASPRQKEEEARPRRTVPEAEGKKE